MTNFWNTDSWFLFVREKGLQFIGKDMAGQLMLDCLVDIFEKPHRYEKQFQAWLEEKAYKEEDKRRSVAVDSARSRAKLSEFQGQIVSRPKKTFNQTRKSKGANHDR